MANFSKQEIGSDITKKISLIGINILSKEMRKISCEKKIIKTNLVHSHLEETIRKIFQSKILSL